MTESTPQARGFVRTLADYYDAQTPATRDGVAREAADRLPLSEWSEARRDILTPQTAAANWLLNVSGTAHELREALTVGAWDTTPRVRDAARALLRALGESEGHDPRPTLAQIAESVTESDEMGMSR